jgi:hypothetical protein
MPTGIRVTQNALVDDQVLHQEPRCKFRSDQSCDGLRRRSVASYLQIRLGDIHERLPRVESLINKGIVIARQVQSLE